MSRPKKAGSQRDLQADESLLADLGLSVEETKPETYTAREERILAGFEDIVRFYEEHGRLPSHAPDGDIFERLYAVRLDRIRELPEASALLSPHDPHGLLTMPSGMISEAELKALSDEDLLAELGIDADTDNITTLRHVASREERQAAEEIANRTPCLDFDQFQPIFDDVDSGLADGRLAAVRFEKNAAVAQGDTFILGGQYAYVAEVGEEIRTTPGKTDARLRVIYSNGTESNLLRRSLQRGLYKDEAGRRIVPRELGGLFGDAMEEGDVKTGTIYVLRSLSTHPFIAAHRELVHKIGVTGGTITSRIGDPKVDATYLLADVEVVAEYKLAGINRAKLETVFHRIFAAAQIDLEIQDRFGNPVKPKEWFLVPLPIIDEAVELVRQGKVEGLVYDPLTASLRMD